MRPDSRRSPCVRAAPDARAISGPQGQARSGVSERGVEPHRCELGRALSLAPKSLEEIHGCFDCLLVDALERDDFVSIDKFAVNRDDVEIRDPADE